MSYLYPAMIVALIGLVAGVILTVAAKFMAVPVNEKVGELREALPGANCGACGFAGCDAYAEAVAEGKECTLCPVGGSAVAEKLAAIMGVEAGSTEPKIFRVTCKGSHTHAKIFSEYDAEIKSCKAANQLYGGNKVCEFGCLGLADCVKACEFDAIHIKDGVAVIDEDKCVACGQCAKACPKHLISDAPKKKLVFVGCSSTHKAPDAMKACKVACIGCKKCVAACKFDAIHVNDFLAKVDYEKCVNCGACVKACPTKALVNRRKKPAPKKPVAANAQSA